MCENPNICEMPEQTFWSYDTKEHRAKDEIYFKCTENWEMSNVYCLNTANMATKTRKAGNSFAAKESKCAEFWELRLNNGKKPKKWWFEQICWLIAPKYCQSWTKAFDLRLRCFVDASRKQAWKEWHHS